MCSAREARSRGFTLIELMITLLIAALVLGIGFPAFKTQRLNADMTSASSDLVSSFVQAKAEAVGRNTFVSVCKRNGDSSACVTGGNWAQGWLTYLSDSAGTLVSSADIIRIHKALPEGMSARGTPGLASLITFRPNGSTSLASLQTLVICDERGMAAARGLVLSIIGKASKISAPDAAALGCLVDPA